MQILNENINEVLTLLKKTDDVVRSDTWDKMSQLNKNIDLIELQNVSGLGEYPKKSNKGLFFINKFPFFRIKSFLRIVFNKNRFNLKEFAFYEKYNLLKKCGIKLPNFNPIFEDFYYNFFGESINANIEKYASFVIKINNYVQKKNLTVLEIGGGYGGLCEMMKINKISNKYVIIDLEETIRYSIQYLAQSKDLNNMEKYLLTDMESLRDIMKKESFIIFIPVSFYIKNRDTIVNILDGKIDLSFNSSSFAEMPSFVVEDYIDFIENINSKYIYSYNRLLREDYFNGKKYIFKGDSLPFKKKWNFLLSENAYFIHTGYDYQEYELIGNRT